MKLERNLILAFLLVAALLPLVVADQYLLHIGILVLFYAVLATSLNLVVGYVGEFSLGHTAFLGIGAYTAAICSLKFGLPMWATVPLAGLVSALFGLAIGAITLRLQGPYFVIVTLAFAEVLRLIANNWIDLANGPTGLAGVVQPQMLLDAPNLFGKQLYFYMALGVAACALYLAYRFIYSNAGRAAVTVRENRYVARPGYHRAEAVRDRAARHRAQDRGGNKRQRGRYRAHHGPGQTHGRAGLPAVLR